ncbi:MULTISPECIES: hypothetical protein [Moraxella]|uniref:DUF4131 domain-containing protein n=1 Tax=Moraxella lacunata TaxID=477 RepID=A0A1B8Q4X1_MORLA|nr:MULTISPECIES: hypothetical protein [Moraxella]MBE9578441.1 hypothetical protein [Moraxella sp. K1664]MBE9587751.1 hypothetical protein [Moraxella sp. K1630]MBE9597038.1 hypothetical protein [Moraxella sp. K2450]MDH9218265.1 hypothetical protein [Moraxella lacunata]MDI4482410.1 hypothetical protein [Moraxella lacunata]
MKNFTKSDYVIMAIFVLLFFWYHNYSYNSAIIIILGFLIFLIINSTKIIKKQKKDTLFIAYFVMGLMIAIISDNIAKHFVAKHQVHTCGVVSQINTSFLKYDTFLLKDHPTNFQLKGNLSIDDKVCITYNPNEKWYGYAYVFDIEKL